MVTADRRTNGSSRKSIGDRHRLLRTVIALLAFSGGARGTTTGVNNGFRNNASTFVQEYKAQTIISGARIELEQGSSVSSESVLHGTDQYGHLIVAPNIPLLYVAYGSSMDKIVALNFTHTDCSTPFASFRAAQLAFQSPTRVAIAVVFPPEVADIRPCFTSSLDPGSIEQVLERGAWVSTNVPPRSYYLPFVVQITVLALLLVLSGLFSGLNLGLMALSPQELQLIIKSGSKTERRYAETILPVRKNGNLLLCTLLLGNVCVNSGISILLDDLSSGMIALVVSSAAIVIFGEIFPQSVCVKKGLAVGARTIFITRFFMVITFVLAYPISKVLDFLLGDEVVAYDRKRLMELIKMNARDENGLAEELKIAVGAMEISDKTVQDVMTKIDDVFMLPDTTVLNTKTVAEILHMGYTRIPVYSGDRNNVISLLFVKDLALLDPDDNFTIQTVCNFHHHPLRFVLIDTPLRIMLEEFKKGDYHLALVRRIVCNEDTDPNYVLAGVVTLEDIVEEILQAEIVDETDAVTDNVHRTKRRAQAADFTHLLTSQEPSRYISVQMQIVTMQWLTSNLPAFKLIAQNIVEKMIRQNVKRVELTHLPDDPMAVIPRTAKLYTKQEFTDKFILILEGRALVTIGQDPMTFEAGPFYAFGSELLDRLAKSLQNETRENKVFQGSRSSLTERSDGKDKKIGFTPDYTVVVKDDCTFLEISAHTFQLAYKTTLISQTTTRPSLCEGASPSARSPLLGHLSGSRTSIRAEVTPRLQRDIDPVARIKRNGRDRAISDGEQADLIARVDFLSPRDGSLFSEDSAVSDS